MEQIRHFYSLLYEKFGDLGWWPADEPFEVMVGAILTQNTNWRNVEKSIEGLKKAGVLSPHGLVQIDRESLAGLIKSSGYFNQKALKLKRFVMWLMEYTDGEISNLGEVSTFDLRAELLSVKGIGPETADDILLYALDRPVFVIDSYTYRIAARHGWVPPESDYNELSELFGSAFPGDIEVYKNFHAGIVEVGKRFCRKRDPLCEDCPGKPLLIDGKPLEFI